MIKPSEEQKLLPVVKAHFKKNPAMVGLFDLYHTLFVRNEAKEVILEGDFLTCPACTAGVNIQHNPVFCGLCGSRLSYVSKES